MILFQVLGQWGPSKNRARDERVLVNKRRGRAVSSAIANQIPLVPCPLFRSSPLNESLEQATHKSKHIMNAASKIIIEHLFDSFNKLSCYAVLLSG